MSTENCQQFINSPLVEELTQEEQVILCGIITTQTLNDGEVLMQEGKIDHKLHGIIKGGLAVGKITGGGNWIDLQQLRQGDLAGELGFIDGLPHSATLRAIGDTEVFILERDKLESLLDEHPHLVYHVMRAIIRVVHTILRRMNTQYVEMTNYITRTHGRY